MKTKHSIYIMTAALALQIGAAVASVTKTDLQGAVMERTMAENPALLAPATPAFATFEDGAPVVEVNIGKIAPVTPVVADFEDEPDGKTAASTGQLAPSTPAEADFEDHI